MKLKLPLLFAFIFNLIGNNQSNAQVSTLPFSAALDSFSIITGTVLDAPMADDVSYTHIPIGFSFDYAGSTQTEMIVSCNGYIQFDTLPSNLFINILSGSSNNRIAAFGADLKNANSNASLQYQTIGTAPNRTCIIQWLHYSYFSGNSGDVSFQIQLHETSNCISFVYGPNFYSNNVLQTQIGLRGNSNADFIVLGDTTCNWATAYPFTSISTQFPVSTSCSMPSGFSFQFGACGNLTGVNLYYITGSVFNDLDGSGVKDISEPPIQHHIMNFSPGNTYASTDANGNYTFFFADTTQTYTISTGGITYWSATTPTSIAINPQFQSTSNVDFGFMIIPNIHEMAITCPAWAAKPGQPEPMPIWYSNNGTSIESDTITFVMDSLYSFISSTPAPLSVNGSTITWVYPTVAPGQGGSIQLLLMPDSNAVLGDYLNSTLSIGPFNDTIPSNNILQLHQLLSNSWDPNEKLVEPSGRILPGTELTYTVHFQNTGNAPAANVTVKDTLDSNLDLLSLSIIGSSHTMNFTMEGQGVAVFTFYNIQLPDSGSDFAGSNGYVSFRVRTKVNLNSNTVINNRAGIIFDSNPAIITNIASDTIDMELSSNPHVLTDHSIDTWPNPTVGNIVFHFTSNPILKGDLKIYSALGKLVYHQREILNSDVINLSSLYAGLYTAIVQTSEGVRTVKIIKQ